MNIRRVVVSTMERRRYTVQVHRCWSTPVWFVCRTKWQIQRYDGSDRLSIKLLAKRELNVKFESIKTEMVFQYMDSNNNLISFLKKSFLQCNNTIYHGITTVYVQKTALWTNTTIYHGNFVNVKLWITADTNHSKDWSNTTIFLYISWYLHGTSKKTIVVPWYK